MRQYLKKELIKTIAIVIVIIVGINAFLPLLTSEVTQDLVEQAGLFGPIILLLYLVLAHLAAPLSDAPAMFIGLPLYGLYPTLLIIYVGSLLSATLNFYIARRFGRSLVIKFVGKKSMGEIDKFTQKMGIKVLIIVRLFGNLFYELVSYAVGFTNMSYKKYISITAICHLFPMLLFFLVLRNAPEGSITSLWLIFVYLFVIGAIFGAIMKWFMNKHEDSL